MTALFFNDNLLVYKNNKLVWNLLKYNCIKAQIFNIYNSKIITYKANFKFLLLLGSKVYYFDIVVK